MVKTPKYWENERFQPLVRVKTVHGNPVMIPKRFLGGWKTATQVYDLKMKAGLDLLDGLETDLEIHPIYYDLERVCWEIYEEEE